MSMCKNEVTWISIPQNCAQCDSVENSQSEICHINVPHHRIPWIATKLNTFRNAPNTLVPRSSLLHVNIITRDLTWTVLNAVFRKTISYMRSAHKAHPVCFVHKNRRVFCKKKKNNYFWRSMPIKAKGFCYIVFSLQRKAIRIFKYHTWYLKISQPQIRHMLSSGTSCQLRRASRK
jgi:hypothetical protein